ncbi:hypothetical protein VHEMI00883 [[Torrubiella] hemipterigena]|uniref:Amidase domain-containing protein n=1 Tax=[Torrubiella] hemipterigena TaxID=1531966 RepID=A0A0A1T5V1_9HYPO|nr:hypothetical protein VHEMI00883 [[Torrubiella] hemipterigena]
MSIVAIPDGRSSAIGREHLKELAARLNFHHMPPNEADDYLTILRSFEAVMDSIDEASDYIPPTLKPQPTTEPRRFWKPEQGSNPFNAWSHRCDLKSSSPISTLLSGHTVAIKDNIAVASLPTTMGLPANMFRSNASSYPVSQIDAVVVARLLAAGATIKGTSTCESYCASPLSWASITGPVQNPRLHGYTSGGSSSGSACLVAAHQLAKAQDDHWGETVEMAIGSDQAGSVRVPASFNGIYGLKPTFGLIPYTGAGSMSSMIDHLGPLASSLEDIALMLEVMAGYDGLDPRMTPESPLPDAVKTYSQILAQQRSQNMAVPHPGHGMKVGLLKEAFDMPGVDKDVRDIILSCCTKYFEAVGVSVIQVSVPMHSQGPIIWTAATRPSMASTLCQGQPLGQLSYQVPHMELAWPPSQETYDSLTDLNPAVINIMLSEEFAQCHTKASLAAKAHRKALELRDAYDTALESVDVLIAPCTPCVAMPHPKTQPTGPDTHRSILEKLKPAVGLTNNTCPFNITGHPALSTPCAYLPAMDVPETLLPVGMQIIGRRWKDEDVLKAAALFEYGRQILK